MTMRMKYRVLSLGAMAWALLVVSAPALAATEVESTHDGKLVSITDGTLVMTDKEGQEHSHTLTADAKLTLDGEACNASDLKPGTKIRVTTQGAEKSVASQIEAIEKNQEFAGFRLDGLVVGIDGNKLIMTDMQGKEERTCTLTADVKVTCDDRVCKPSDLKAGMRIRVTSVSDYPLVVFQIEALDKNLEFAGL